MISGQDLDDVERLPEIEGLNIGKPIYNAIFCTHYHSDHIGRVNEALPEIPIYMSDVSRKITETVFCFSKSKGKFTHNTIDIQDNVPVKIKDMVITPFTVDHSAYGAFMFLIEAEGKKILHTGDFRNHGYKGKLLPIALKKIGKIDLLITEGTTLSREQMKSQSEAELASEMAKMTDRYKQVLVLTSTTNIDRITDIQRCANRTNKTVIHDLLLSNVLQFVTQKIPNALNSSKVDVFMPRLLIQNEK